MIRRPPRSTRPYQLFPYPTPCRYNGRVTQATLPALAALGYAYYSSAHDDDAPYLMGSGGAVLVELPVFDYLTDAKFYTHRHTDVRVARAWAEEDRKSTRLNSSP